MLATDRGSISQNLPLNLVNKKAQMNLNTARNS